MDGASLGEESALGLVELEARITELAGHLNAAQHRWLVLIAEFDRRRGWSGAGIASCAHWLNFKCGLNLGAAREKVRVAHALRDLPRIVAAMARGELSYSKVRAITRVACPATEENLLNIALHGTAYHVETIVRLYRRAQQAEELSREKRQHRNRSVSYHFDEDGSLVLRAQLPAVAGATLLKALEVAMADVPTTEVSEGQPERQVEFRARRADALSGGSLSSGGGTERAGGDGAARGLRCELARDPRGRARRTARCRAQDAQHPAADPSRLASARCGVPLSRLHVSAMARRASHRALGGWRGDQAVEPGEFVPLAPSAGARGRGPHRARRQRRVALHQAER